MRAPNLVTAPGDPIAGYLLAAGAASRLDPRLGWTVFASLCFYAGGLVMNDVADARVDRIERPARPIPSGAISIGAARVAVFLLFGLALGACVMAGGRAPIIGAALSASIAAYNLLFKNVRLLGPVVMGLCRSLSMILGASIVGTANPLLLGASAGLTAFIATLTLVARREMNTRRADWSGWFPVGVVLGLMTYFVRTSPAEGAMHGRMVGAFFLAFLLTSVAALRGGTPGAVGLMICALLPLQAAFCLGANAGDIGLAAAFLLLAMWPVNRLLSRWFYGS